MKHADDGGAGRVQPGSEFKDEERPSSGVTPPPDACVTSAPRERDASDASKMRHALQRLCLALISPLLIKPSIKLELTPI